MHSDIVGNFTAVGAWCKPRPWSEIVRIWKNERGEKNSSAKRLLWSTKLLISAKIWITA